MVVAGTASVDTGVALEEERGVAGLAGGGRVAFGASGDAGLAFLEGVDVPSGGADAGSVDE